MGKQYHHLTREQRYHLYIQWSKGASQKEIAQELSVHPSSVSRELKRNRLKNGGYLWLKAQEMADKRKARTANNNAIEAPVLMLARDLILKDFSPEQASGYLRLKGHQVSTERIYQMVRKDDELQKHLHHGLKGKRRQKAKRETKVKNIPNRTSIHERPAEANGRRFGDWEMDLIVDGRGGAILTLVERSTTFMMMRRLPHGKNAEGVADAAIALLYPYRKKVLTITTDNGGEFAAHDKIAQSLKGVKIYFADSYSSWQKGCIENTNKLIRFYLPKGHDLRSLTDEQVMRVQKTLNKRPRKKLKYNCPKDVFFKNFA